MDKIKRFQLAVQALVYTGLLSVVLESGVASAQWQSAAPRSSAPVAESSQPPDWLLPIGGISLLAISFGIEIFRHRCFLESAEENDLVCPESQLSEQPWGTTAPLNGGSCAADPLRKS